MGVSVQDGRRGRLGHWSECDDSSPESSHGDIQRRVLDHVLREQCALEPNGNVVLLLSGDDRTGPGCRRSSFKRGRSGDPACPSSRLVRILMTCEPLDRGLSAVGLLVGPIGLLVSEGHIQ